MLQHFRVLLRERRLVTTNKKVFLHVTCGESRESARFDKPNVVAGAWWEGLRLDELFLNDKHFFTLLLVFSFYRTI